MVKNTKISIDSIFYISAVYSYQTNNYYMENEMETVTVKVKFKYDPKSFAACYDEYDTQENRDYVVTQAQVYAELAVNDYMKRIGFSGEVINPSFEVCP